MTGCYHAPSWNEKDTIPVKRGGDRWKFFFGGDLPVADGSVGKLTGLASPRNGQGCAEKISRKKNG